MTSVEIEIGKMELIREIMDINSGTTLKSLKSYLKELLHKDNTSQRNILTRQMINKYAGSWDDNRSTNEIIDDIYDARLSHRTNSVSPFDE